MTTLDEKFAKLYTLTRPVNNDFIRYESALEYQNEPFGVIVEDGKKSSEVIENTLQEIEKTYDKLNAVEETASDIDEELEKYGIEGKVVRLSFVNKKKQLDDIKESYEKRKEIVELQVDELEDFLSEAKDLKSWTDDIRSKTDEVCFADEKPENIEKQINEIEVIIVKF